MEYKKGQLIDVVISDMAEDEKCYARMDDGMSAFIRGTLAVGDRVQAEIYKTKKKFIEARAVEVTERSPSRIDPACDHFGICGGCKWQHVTYEEQLRLKRKRIADALRHLGGVANPQVSDVIPAPSIYGYRNKLDFSFSDKRYLLPEEVREEAEITKRTDFALGFHAPRQYAKAIDIDHCHLAPEEMNIALNAIRDFALERELTCYSTKTHEGYLRNLVVRKAEVTGQFMVNLVTSSHDEDIMADLLSVLQHALGDRLTTFVNNISTKKNNSAFGEEEHVVFGPGVIVERLGSFEFEISANSFFQTNTRQAMRLYDEIVSMAAPTQEDVVYDFYSGTGSISLFLASSAQKVLGFECVGDAVRNARKNAQANGITNCVFQELDLKDLKTVKPVLDSFGAPDIVVTDPPRAGMHPKALGMLVELSPKRIVYVSCNPASLARDGKELLRSGQYTLDAVLPIDMFPHTNHIESVACFQRINAE